MLMMRREVNTMRALIVSAKKPALLPTKKVKAISLFVDREGYERLKKVALYVKDTSYGSSATLAKQILTGTYTKDTTGGRALERDVKALYDVALRSMEDDLNVVLQGMMKA